MSRKDYVNVRVSQLEDESRKQNSDYDVQWYSRLIQELKWAESMLLGKEKENCSLPRVQQEGK